MKSSTKNRSPRFDCELPPEVRVELMPPRRPKILEKSVVLGSLGILMACGGIATAIVFGSLAIVMAVNRIATVQPVTAQPTPTPVSTPTPIPQPAPLLVSSPNDERFFAPEVRRAEPVGLEARMPYGESVRIRILGTLPDQESLPLTGNHIGDAYHVGDAEFVWVAPEGIGQWIDPSP